MPTGSTLSIGSLSDAVSGYEAGLKKHEESEDASIKEAKGKYETEMDTANEAEKNLDPNVLKPPTATPAPTEQETSPVKIWGSAAMWMAGLGSLLTRRPLTNALNAAGAVMNAYKKSDAAAAQQAYATWKTETENATKMAQFSIDAYKTALSKIESDKKGALSEFTVTAKALGDENAAYVAQHYGVDAAVRYVDAMQSHTNRMAGEIPKIEIANQQMQLGIATLKAGQAVRTAQQSGDPAKIKAATEAFQAAQQDSQSFNAGIGKGGTSRTFRSLPAAFANKYLQEHPNATAEDMENAATEYNEMQSGGRTLGTRSTQIDLAATEAGNFANQALAASKAVPRTNWRIVNSAIQAGQTQSSDPNLQKLLVATDALVNARARAISPSGQPHLSDQIEGRKLLSTAQSPETYEASVQQMLAEVQGVKDATKTVKGEVLSGKSGGDGQKRLKYDAQGNLINQ